MQLQPRKTDPRLDLRLSRRAYTYEKRKNTYANCTLLLKDEHRIFSWASTINCQRFTTLAASSGKRSVTVWRLSVCLSRGHTHRDSPGGSMRRGQRIFRFDSKEDRRTCYLFIVYWTQRVATVQHHCTTIFTALTVLHSNLYLQDR